MSVAIRVAVRFLIVVALAACRADDTDLAALNCQLDDIPTTIPYAAATPVTTPPAPELFGEEVLNYHLAEFNEQSLTYQTIRCEMIQYEDDAAAARAFTTACNQSIALEGGASTCSFGEGVETVVLWHNEIIVSITADLNGTYARELAEFVMKRLR